MKKIFGKKNKETPGASFKRGYIVGYRAGLIDGVGISNKALGAAINKARNPKIRVFDHEKEAVI